MNNNNGGGLMVSYALILVFTQLLTLLLMYLFNMKVVLEVTALLSQLCV